MCLFQEQCWSILWATMQAWELSTPLHMQSSGSFPSPSIKTGKRCASSQKGSEFAEFTPMGNVKIHFQWSSSDYNSSSVQQESWENTGSITKALMSFEWSILQSVELHLTLNLSVEKVLNKLCSINYSLFVIFIFYLPNDKTIKPISSLSRSSTA